MEITASFRKRYIVFFFDIVAHISLYSNYAILKKVGLASFLRSTDYKGYEEIYYVKNPKYKHIQSKGARVGV